MRMSEQNIGRKVYIVVDSSYRQLYEGTIVSLGTYEDIRGRQCKSYNVEIDTKESYLKTMTLYQCEYKDDHWCSSMSFFFVKEQAIQRLKQKEKAYQKEVELRKDLKIIETKLTLAQIETKTRDELLQDLLGANITDLKIKQSQLNQINIYFDKIDEIIKNQKSTMFNFYLAFNIFGPYGQTKLPVDINKLMFILSSENLYGKVQKPSIKIYYETHGYSLKIDIKKWNKFFS